MANYIQTLQDRIEQTLREGAAAADLLDDLIGYLTSPKFAGESDLSGYVNVKDVLTRTQDLRSILSGIRNANRRHEQEQRAKMFGDA